MSGPIETILSEFATRLEASADAEDPGIGLKPTNARPLLGAQQNQLPAAFLGVTQISPGEETGISSAALGVRLLTATLYVFAQSELQLWRYMDALMALYGELNWMQIGNLEVIITWGEALVPEPLPEADPSTYYQVQQTLLFDWS